MIGPLSTKVEQEPALLLPPLALAPQHPLERLLSGRERRC